MNKSDLKRKRVDVSCPAPEDASSFYKRLGLDILTPSSTSGQTQEAGPPKKRPVQQASHTAPLTTTPTQRSDKVGQQWHQSQQRERQAPQQFRQNYPHENSYNDRSASVNTAATYRPQYAPVHRPHEQQTHYRTGVVPSSNTYQPQHAQPTRPHGYQTQTRPNYVNVNNIPQQHRVHPTHPHTRTEFMSTVASHKPQHAEQSQQRVHPTHPNTMSTAASHKPQHAQLPQQRVVRREPQVKPINRYAPPDYLTLMYHPTPTLEDLGLTSYLDSPPSSPRTRSPAQEEKPADSQPERESARRVLPAWDAPTNDFFDEESKTTNSQAREFRTAVSADKQSSKIDTVSEAKKSALNVTNQMRERHQVNVTNQMSERHQANVTNQMSERHQANVTNQMRERHQANVTNQMSERHQANVTNQMSERHQANVTNQMSERHQANVTNQMSERHQANVTNQMSERHQANVTNQMSERHQANVTNQMIERHQAYVTNQMSERHQANVTNQMSERHRANVTNQRSERHQAASHTQMNKHLATNVESQRYVPSFAPKGWDPTTKSSKSLQGPASMESVINVTSRPAIFTAPISKSVMITGPDVKPTNNKRPGSGSILAENPEKRACNWSMIAEQYSTESRHSVNQEQRRDALYRRYNKDERQQTHATKRHQNHDAMYQEHTDVPSHNQTFDQILAEQIARQAELKSKNHNQAPQTGTSVNEKRQTCQPLTKSLPTVNMDDLFGGLSPYSCWNQSAPEDPRFS